MDTFQTELLSNQSEFPTQILSDERFKSYINSINEGCDWNWSKIELQNLLYALDYAYHVLGLSFVSDLSFETLEEVVKKNYPDTILYSESYMSQSVLPYPVPTLTKFYNTSFSKLQKKLSEFTHVMISSKLDGVSCLLVKTNKISLYTKGNGIKGRNISYILPFLSLDLSKLPPKCALRGELVIKKDSHLRDEKKNSLRSAVIGAINADYTSEQLHGKKILKEIDFVFYHVIKPKNFSFVEQFDFIRQMNLLTPMFRRVEVKSLTKDKLEKMYDEFIENEKYSIDGLVIAESDHKYDWRNIDPLTNKMMFAFKQNKHFALTTITRIEWKPSKYRHLIPLIFVKPVVLLTVNVKSCQGFTAKRLIDLQLGVGAQVRITLTGNIIPYIDTIYSGSNDFQFPPNATWDGNHLISEEREDELTALSKVIELYFSLYGIKGYTNKSIKRVIDFFNLFQPSIMINNIFDFVTTVPTWIESHQTRQNILGPKKDKDLYDAIQTIRKHPMPISRFLAATNYFYLIGETKLHTLFSECKEVLIFLTTTRVNQTPEELLDELNMRRRLNDVHSIGPKMVDSFIQGLILFKRNQLKFNNLFNIVYDIKSPYTDLKHFVFTGVKNLDYYLSLFKDLFILDVALTKKTDYLVIPNTDFTPTTKFNKAQVYNIPIIRLKDFIIMMNEKKNQM